MQSSFKLQAAENGKLEHSNITTDVTYLFSLNYAKGEKNFTKLKPVRNSFSGFLSEFANNCPHKNVELLHRWPDLNELSSLVSLL